MSIKEVSFIDPDQESGKERRKRIRQTLKLNNKSDSLRSLYKKIPTNARLFLENLAGIDRPITNKDFTDDELIEMMIAIEKTKEHNDRQEMSLRQKIGNQSYASVSDYRDDPRKKEALESYEKTRGRTSVNPYNKLPHYTEKGDRVTDTLTGDVDKGWIDSLTGSFTDPKYVVDTSLGRYKAHDERVNPEKYNYRIEDTYNFNRGRDSEEPLPSHLFGRNEDGDFGIIDHVLYSPEIAGEYLYNLFRTKDRPVDIRLESKKSGGKVRKTKKRKKSGGKVYTNQNKRYAHGGKVSGRKAKYNG